MHHAPLIQLRCSKVQDLETLKSFWYAREMPHEAAIIHVIEAYRQPELRERARILTTAMDLFSQSKARAHSNICF